MPAALGSSRRYLKLMGCETPNDTQPILLMMGRFCSRNLRHAAMSPSVGYSSRAVADSATLVATTAYSFGDDSGQLGEYAWYKSNSGGTTHTVGQLKPNAWGLYDMHGNVWEWVHDWYEDYPSEPVTDPTGPTKGAIRVLRGGCWFDVALSCRAADRYHVSPADRGFYLGFRLARSAALGP